MLTLVTASAAFMAPLAPATSSVRVGRSIMMGGKGFGGGEATRDPAPTVYDPNDPKGKQQAIHKAESFAEYLAKRGAVTAGPGAVAPAPAPAAAMGVRARRPIVGGNWKCNPDSPTLLPGLVANINACDTSMCDVYVCPSPLHVGMVYQSFTNGAHVAPQNCNFKGCGAYTGEMAVDQMAAMGLKWCLIGHSERRGEFGLPTPAESNALMATKLAYILEKGLNCVFCIGEPLPIREQGIGAVMAECTEQLKDIVPILSTLTDHSRVVIAYEPVWAIGTGVTASPEQAQETHAGIRNYLAGAVGAELAANIRIQYGGSANAENAPDLSAQPDIDGFLVGGASLKPEFAQIVSAIAAVKGVAV